MNTLHINSSSCQQSVLLVSESIANIANYLPQKRIIVITDNNVKTLLPDSLLCYSVILVGQGEEAKTLLSIEKIIGRLIELEADRDTFILAVGGGIVCDMAGFVASIYMRGLRFGFIPTTLLAQVDASVGGKNGVNFRHFKNIIGTFNQPEFVLCDPAVLQTLPVCEISAGYAEVIKTALIADAALFNFAETHAEQALQLNPAVTAYLIYEALKIKARIVEADEREKGERRKLNLGHTLGHAIETHSGILHGEAVGIGTAMAAHLSCRLGLLSLSDVQRIEQVLQAYNLPIVTSLSAEELFLAILKDKKREVDHLYFVLLKSVGEAEIRRLSFTDLKPLLYDLCKPY